MQLSVVFIICSFNFRPSVKCDNTSSSHRCWVYHFENWYVVWKIAHVPYKPKVVLELVAYFDFLMTVRNTVPIANCAYCLLNVLPESYNSKTVCLCVGTEHLGHLIFISSVVCRQRSRVSSGLNEDDFTFGVNNRIADPEEWDINSRTDWLLASEETRKRPPGLTKEALNSLHTMIFINQEEESVKMRASKECSICLDSFLVGEKLLCLPCGHRFHSCCLEPWIRTCGDCPNCRTGIVVSNYRPVKWS